MNTKHNAEIRKMFYAKNAEIRKMFSAQNAENRKMFFVKNAENRKMLIKFCFFLAMQTFSLFTIHFALYKTDSEF